LVKTQAKPKTMTREGARSALVFVRAERELLDGIEGYRKVLASTALGPRATQSAAVRALLWEGLRAVGRAPDPRRSPVGAPSEASIEPPREP